MLKTAGGISFGTRDAAAESRLAIGAARAGVSARGSLVLAHASDAASASGAIPAASAASVVTALAPSAARRLTRTLDARAEERLAEFKRCFALGARIAHSRTSIVNTEAALAVALSGTRGPNRSSPPRPWFTEAGTVRLVAFAARTGCAVEVVVQPAIDGHFFSNAAIGAVGAVVANIIRGLGPAIVTFTVRGKFAAVVADSIDFDALVIFAADRSVSAFSADSATAVGTTVAPAAIGRAACTIRVVGASFHALTIGFEIAPASCAAIFLAAFVSVFAGASDQATTDADNWRITITAPLSVGEPFASIRGGIGT